LEETRDLRSIGELSSPGGAEFMGLVWIDFRRGASYIRTDELKKLSRVIGRAVL